MEIPADAEVKSIIIQGISFVAPLPYQEGHVLTANEISALNQVFHENIRNNFANRVKKLVEEAETNGAELDEAALQSELNDYIESYEFGIRTGGGRVTDPVESEALKIATSKVHEAMKKKGIKRKDVSADNVRELARQVLDDHPDLLDQARVIVEARNAAATEIELPDVG